MKFKKTDLITAALGAELGCGIGSGNLGWTVIGGLFLTLWLMTEFFEIWQPVKSNG
jgi:hypothetical protein